MTSSETDWLDAEPAPAPQKPAAKAEARTPRRATKKGKRPVALVRALRALTQEKRYFLQMLLESMTYREAEDRFINAGYPKRDRATFWRWRQEPVFAEALGHAYEYQLQVSQLSKARLVSDAEKVKQIALEPKPILYKGRKTKHKEVDLGAAMRAVEFQGKAIGITDPDQRGVKVNIDIDFSGRAEGVTIEGEVEETMAVD